jgi:two-component system sensor histidine kinase/response regulator
MPSGNRAQKMERFIEKLIGGNDQYHLEARVYHGICLLSLLVIIITAIMNFLMGIPVLGLLMLPAIMFLCTLFYLSRYKFMLNTSVVLFCSLGYLVFIVNFYYNSGIDGPTLMIFMLLLFITISIVPGKQYFFWMGLNILVVTVLLALQYHYNGVIKNTYPLRVTRYIDSAYAYMIITPLIFLVTVYIRRSYNQERERSDLKSEQLEKANESKDKLLSILAHDLRSPLVSIQSFLELMSDFDLSAQEELMIKKTLLNETKNAYQMLTNLLSWSKAQMAGVTPQIAPVNLAEVLEITLALQHTAAAEKLIGFRNEIITGLKIVADPDMLDLVVRNLVNNAIKFTQEGGEVVIYTEQHEEECYIIIEDNGKGIPYNKQPDIFKLKTQSTFGTKNEKGVGLGLVLCKEFINFQNGKIWFESVPEKGTKFYISLPLYESFSLMKGSEIMNDL